MTAGTRLWVRKAEGDYDVILTLRRSRKASRFDAICFHAQQCAEKYLKALLHESGEYVPKTHDLSALLELLLPDDALWIALRPRLADLARAAVAFRYPDAFADALKARRSVETCRLVRQLARERLGLPR